MVEAVLAEPESFVAFFQETVYVTPVVSDGAVHFKPTLFASIETAIKFVGAPGAVVVPGSVAPSLQETKKKAVESKEKIATLKKLV